MSCVVHGRHSATAYERSCLAWLAEANPAAVQRLHKLGVLVQLLATTSFCHKANQLFFVAVFVAKITVAFDSVQMLRCTSADGCAP